LFRLGKLPWLVYFDIRFEFIDLRRAFTVGLVLFRLGKLPWLVYFDIRCGRSDREPFGSGGIGTGPQNCQTRFDSLNGGVSSVATVGYI
jgi:hypothetical protein